MCLENTKSIFAIKIVIPTSITSLICLTTIMNKKMIFLNSF